MSLFLTAIYDRFMRPAEEGGLGAWRRELLADAAGDVLEVGAGTGVNLAHVPSAVRRLVLAEPDRAMRRVLVRRIAAARRAQTETGAAGRALEALDAPCERLPFADASFDAVVATLVLCSVADPQRALAEIRRVLRPAGRLYFIEHVASPRADRARWQRRLEPVWKRLADNCHLTRRTDELIVAAGFELVWIERASMRKALPIVRASVRGVARPRAAVRDTLAP